MSPEFIKLLFVDLTMAFPPPVLSSDFLPLVLSTASSDFLSSVLSASSSDFLSAASSAT